MHHGRHKLHYHSAPQRKSFPWKRVIGWVAVILLIAALGILGYEGYGIGRFAWIQQQCMLYRGDANLPVFDSRPSALATFHRSGAGWNNGSLSVFHRSEAETRIPYVTYMPAELERYDPTFKPHGVVFMHARRSPAGNNRLVIVIADPPNGLAYCVLKQGFKPAPISSKLTADPVHAYAGLGSLDEKPVAIFAGKVDTVHPDHFTIPYQFGGKDYIVDCWLEDDDSIRMEDSRLNPGSPPSSALSR